MLSRPHQPVGIFSVTDDNADRSIEPLFINRIHNGLKIRAAARNQHSQWNLSRHSFL
jgi:hypothetical protein